MFEKLSTEWPYFFSMYDEFFEIRANQSLKSPSTCLSDKKLFMKQHPVICLHFTFYDIVEFGFNHAAFKWGDMIDE